MATRVLEDLHTAGCYSHEVYARAHLVVDGCFTRWSSAHIFSETWRFPAQYSITHCSPCEVPRRTAACMKPIQIDHATVNFPGFKALPREAPIA